MYDSCFCFQFDGIFLEPHKARQRGFKELPSLTALTQDLKKRKADKQQKKNL